MEACDAANAEACFEKAVKIAPDFAEGYANLGALLTNKKRFIEAESTYRQAIEFKPHAPEAWSNLGVLCACLKRETEAERCHRTALFLDNTFAMARFNLSYLLLRQGRFEEGWQVHTDCL
jgi:Flp pilus assembly protein TadD